MDENTKKQIESIKADIQQRQNHIFELREKMQETRANEANEIEKQLKSLELELCDINARRSKHIAEFRDLETIARRKYNLHVGTIKRKFSSERSKLDEELRSEANAIRISTSEIDYMYRCGNTE